MELYKKIGEILKAKQITKREFAQRLIQREIRSNRSGEILSESTIYAYLNGTTSIRADLIPHICDILDISEQELFEFNPKNRARILKLILENPTEEEKHIVKLSFNDNSEFKHYDDFNLRRISDLLIYAPTIAIEEMIDVLERYKELYGELKRSY